MLTGEFDQYIAGRLLRQRRHQSRRGSGENRREERNRAILQKKDVFIFRHKSQHLTAHSLYPSDDTTGHVVAPNAARLGCA